MRNLFFSIVCLCTFFRSNADNCFFVDFSIPNLEYSVFLTDNSIGGINCPGLTEIQNRPIYTCETLAIRIGSSIGYQECSGNGVSTITVNIFDASNNLVGTQNISNTISGSPPSPCLYSFNINSLGLATGVYKIQVIYNSSIYGEGLAYIVNNNAPNLITSVTQSNPCNFSTNQVCVNVNTALASGLLNQYYIDWGDGNTSALCPGGSSCPSQVCYTYSALGSYIVKVLPYISSPCPLPTYPIYISNLTASIPGPLFYCTNTGLQTFSVVSSGGKPTLTYSWSSSVIQPTATPGTFTFNTATGSSGSYTVTVTDGNGCTATASVAVNLNNNCCIGSTITCGGITKSLTYTGPVNASQIWSDVCGTTIGSTRIIDLSAFGSDKRIAINGNLTIDGDYMFRNCTYTVNNPNTWGGILFAQNVKVIIPNTRKLTIQNSYLFACGNNQWAGIEVANGGILVTQSTTSNTGFPIIADATVAINGVGGAIGLINLTNTRFYRNWVGVNIPSAVNYGGTINGCTFSYNAADPLQNYMLQPYSGKRTAVGIFANNMTGAQWVINNTGTTANTFERINNGIYAYRSNVRVHTNNVFNFIWNYDNVNPSSGIGVYAISLTGSQNTILVQTNSLSSSAAFNNCATAVYLNNVNAIVQNNYMLNDSTGIFATACPTTSLDFNNNTITNTFAGITFNNVNGTLSRTIAAQNDNIITVNEPLVNFPPLASYPSPYGIAHLETSASSVTCNDGTRNCRVLIENNTIYNGRYGIFLNNAYGTRVTFNDVYQTNSVSTNGLKAGLYASNCLAPLITKNQFFGNGNTYDETAASTASNRRNGVLVFNSTGAELCSNTFTSLGYAMQFQAGCAGTMLKNNGMDGIGVNGYRYGVVLRKSGVEGVIGTQGTLTLSHGNSFSGNFTNASGFRTFTFQSSGANSKFNIFNHTNNTVQPWPNGADVAGQEIKKDNSNSANTWQCSTGAGIWKSLIVNQGDLYAKEIAEGDGVQFVEQGLEESGTWMLEKDLFERLSDNQAMLNSKPLYQDFYESKEQTSIGDIKRFEEALLTLEDSVLVTDSASLAAQVDYVATINSQIQANSEYEQNRKWVNELHLRTIAQGNVTFTNSQKQQLFDLANQCPFAGGDAVFIARTLYNLIDHNAYFNDEEICANLVAFKKEQKVKKTVADLSVSISPNPASEIVDITIKNSLEDLIITIYNTAGQLLGSASINNYVELNVSDFPNGVYLVKFSNGADILHQQRLIISR